MRNLHLEKQGLRGLAIAESFTETSKKSVLAGIVISTEMVIDGFVFDHSTVGGDDATEVILSMYERLDRPDVSFLLISGIVISLYNIVDVKKISEKIGLPVIGVHMKTLRVLKMLLNITFQNPTNQNFPNILI